MTLTLGPPPCPLLSVMANPKDAHYTRATLSWHFIINSSVEFAICKVGNFSPAWRQTHRVL